MDRRSGRGAGKRRAAMRPLSSRRKSWSVGRWCRDTPSGRLRHLKPVVQLSETPPYWARPSVPLGYHQPVWPERGE